MSKESPEKGVSIGRAVLKRVAKVTIAFEVEMHLDKTFSEVEPSDEDFIDDLRALKADALDTLTPFGSARITRVEVLQEPKKIADILKELGVKP